MQSQSNKETFASTVTIRAVELVAITPEALKSFGGHTIAMRVNV